MKCQIKLSLEILSNIFETKENEWKTLLENYVKNFVGVFTKTFPDHNIGNMDVDLLSDRNPESRPTGTGEGTAAPSISQRFN